MESQTEIDKFIQKKLKAGYPAGELRNDLLNKGYAEEEIEALFLKVSVKGSAVNEQGAKQRTQMHMLSLVGASLLIMGIAVMSTQTWLKEYSTFLIVLGVVGLVAGYFISSRRGPGKSSS